MTTPIEQRLQRYDASDLALYEKYRPNREQHRPAQCKRTGLCWVEYGPPAFGRHSDGCKGRCLECGAVP